MMFELFRFLVDVKEIRVNSNELTSALNSMICGKVVSEYISAALNDTARFRSSFLYSAKHQLGFDKFIIFESGGQFNRRIRIHLWDNAALSQPDIHDHAYAFASKLIVGSLEQKSFALDQLGDPYLKLSFDADGRSCVPTGHDEEILRLKEKERTVLRPEEIYFVDQAHLHSVRALDIPTVTVQLQDAVQMKTVSVYRSTADLRPMIASFAQPLSPDDLRERLKFLVASLSGGR